MRYFKPLLIVLLAFLIIGWGTKEAKLTKGTKPGYLAPNIQLQGNFSNYDEYVLLQFWAAYDPESRVNNILIHNEVAKLGSNKLKLLSVSFDENSSVFEETIKADKLDKSTQFNDPQGEKSEIFKIYQLNKGFGNVLIDPQGVIIARNIQPDELKSILL